MANYSIVINSKFNPFSYQEMLHPVMTATQAQQQVEEAYANLAMEAGLAGSKINEQVDKGAYRTYKAYSDELSGLAERLAKNGLTPEDRRTMYNMRARYAKDIVPIETAYATRKAQADQQQAAKLQNPTLLLGRDAATTSLDEYIKNPNMGYDSYSGALLTQQVSTAVANMAKTDEGRTQLRQLLPYQYETIRQRGFRPQDVLEAVMNSPNANQILTGVVENVMNASGIKNWANERTLSDAYNYARMGLYNAIGDTVYGSVTDSAGMARLQADLSDRNNEREFNRKLALQNSQGNGETSYRILSDVSEGNADMKALNQDLNILNQIEKRGGWKERVVSKETAGTYAKQDVTGRTSVKAPYAKLINGDNDNNSNSGEAVYANSYSRIAKKYGLDGRTYNAETLQKLKQLVQNDINNSIVRNNTYKLNITDSSGIAQVLYENSQTAYSSRGNATGFTSYEKGKTKKSLSSKDVAKIAKEGKDFSFDYKPNVGFVLNYRLDGETKAAVVDPSLLGYGNRYSNDTQGHKYITSLLNSGKYEEAAEDINGMMNDLYYMFNTRRVKQSNTGDIE